MRVCLAALLVAIPAVSTANRVAGPMPPKTVEEIIRAHAGEVARCRKNARAPLTVELTIGTDGIVGDVRLLPKGFGPARRCIITHVAKWQFPPSPQFVEVTWEFGRDRRGAVSKSTLALPGVDPSEWVDHPIASVVAVKDKSERVQQIEDCLASQLARSSFDSGDAKVEVLFTVLARRHVWTQF